MTPDDLAAAAQTLFGAGHGSIKKFAAALGVSYDAMRHVLSGRRAMPPGWADDVRRLLTGASDQVTRAPEFGPDIDRDELCADAIEPHLDLLAARALVAGWHPAEIVAAVVGWGAHQAAENAGPKAAIELLTGAIEVVRLSR
jgi:DNA-binding transcriptional regulator YdaS (Cro superfamily)